MAGLRLIQLTNAGGIPRAAEIGIDWRVLVFTLVTSVVTGIFFGLAPIVSFLIGDIAGSLKETAGNTTPAAGAQVFRRALVAGELSLALVLLIGCGLMVRAFWKLQEVHTGVDPRNVITMRVNLPSGSYTQNAKIDAFWRQLEERLSSLPGVQSAALFPACRRWSAKHERHRHRRLRANRKGSDPERGFLPDRQQKLLHDYGNSFDFRTLL